MSVSHAALLGMSSVVPLVSAVAYTESMTAAATKILEGALALPGEDRRRIAELLLDSVSTDTPEEIEAAWVAEAVRRADELERGDAEALDGRSVLEDLKAKFQSAR